MRYFKVVVQVRITTWTGKGRKGLLNSIHWLPSQAEFWILICAQAKGKQSKQEVRFMEFADILASIVTLFDAIGEGLVALALGFKTAPAGILAF